MPGLLLLLSLSCVMELLHWSITDKSKFINLCLCTPSRHMGEWSYSSAHSWPHHWIEVSGLASWPDGFTAKESACTHCWMGFENRKLCSLIWESNNSVTVQNFIVRVIWHTLFVHPLFTLFLKVRVMVCSLRR
jgi:hypothetical protein